jgi:succinate dehydrogenase (ubiquinone) cytochrome b560 subunit
LGPNGVKRPLSPALSIYEPQLTWLMSIGHRVTGAFHSTLLYTAGTSFALVPLLTDTSIPELYTNAVQQAQAMPLAAIIVMKLGLAVPFTFHCLNGVRHLIWDTGYALTMPGVYATGWTVNLGSILGGAYLALFL